MGVQGYGQYIQEQIQNWPVKEPITTVAVAAALAGSFGIDMENAKKVTNVNMKRLADKGELIRVQKGVYGKMKETPFGMLAPSSGEMLAGLLLRDGENVIGYITGPTLLNAIGLCSWIPKERHIATNRFRHRLPVGAPICIYKPILTVDNQNAPYLRALEAIAAMEHYPIDAERPEEILRGMLREGHIDNERLIWYARHHCGQRMLLKTIDVALGKITQ